MKKIGLSLLFLGVLAFAQAQEDEKTVKFLLGAAFEFGGDEVAKVIFTNGDDQAIRAGQGGSIHGGLEVAFPGAEALRFRGSIGYKYVTTAADNANITLTRIPLHASLNYVIQDAVRLGVGVAAHQNIKFKADGLGDDFEFKSTAGPMFEVAYKWFGLVYTSMNYEDESGTTYDASSFGFTFYGTF